MCVSSVANYIEMQISSGHVDLVNLEALHFQEWCSNGISMHLACSRDGLRMWLGFPFGKQMQTIESAFFLERSWSPVPWRVWLSQYCFISNPYYFIRFHSHWGPTAEDTLTMQTHARYNWIGRWASPELPMSALPKAYKPVLTEEAPTSPDGHSVTWPRMFGQGCLCLV